MTPEEKFNQDVWYVLKRIRGRSLYTKKGDQISYEVYLNIIGGGYPSAADEMAILGKLEEWGAIRILNQGGTAEYYRKRVFKIKIIQLRFDELYRLYEGGLNNQDSRKQSATVKKNQPIKIEITKLPKLQFDNTSENKSLIKAKTITLIPIRDTRLDEQNYLLEINNGEKVISFKSKKKGGGLEKETKQFKILCHLWEFRWEFKNSKVLKKGDYSSLDNLARGSGSESTEAAYKHIQRLNSRFQNEGIAIEIKGENEKYRLIINKT